jgi:hypothetical protein
MICFRHKILKTLQNGAAAATTTTTTTTTNINNNNNTHKYKIGRGFKEQMEKKYCMGSTSEI